MRYKISMREISEQIILEGLFILEVSASCAEDHFKLNVIILWKNQVLKLIFLWELEQNILNKYNCNGHPANVKDTVWHIVIHTLVVKPKIIESICLINQIIREMHLILESHMI